MTSPRVLRDHLTIWAFAFGYFAFYTPYSALTKALSQGLLPGMDGPVPGLLILPATAIGTSLLLLLFLTAMGGWSALERRTLLGVAVPVARWQTTCSGIATAVIIATTTLNYTFVGLSILLVLLLMRGGVLILAPVLDRLHGRRVDGLAWLALGLSFAAIAVAFSEVRAYTMTLLAALNVAAYLAGYLVRLHFMSQLAKRGDRVAKTRYFVEETAVAAIALTAIPAVLALALPGEGGAWLRDGFTTFLGRDLARPAFLIGLLYACLYLFGTGIYIDGREHTFCIPLNRCASLMSGIVASFALAAVFGWKPPSVYQLAGSGIILLALAVLMLSTVQAYRRSARVAVRRLFLFVCGGNTSRSPMAQAICNDEIARRLGLPPVSAGDGQVRALSAGLTATPGRPFTAASVATLRGIGVTPHDHASRPVTPELVAEAELVFCMTEGQRRELAERFPEASHKIHRLDHEADIDDPSALGEDAYRLMADRLRRLIRLRLPALSSS